MSELFFRPISITLLSAGCFRFLTLIQYGDRLARYGRSLCFETRALQAHQAGVVEQVRADLALFEVGQ